MLNSFLLTPTSSSIFPHQLGVRQFNAVVTLELAQTPQVKGSVLPDSPHFRCHLSVGYLIYTDAGLATDSGVPATPLQVR